MKLLIVTCLKEYQNDVIQIFKEANIHIFSVSDVIGFKDHPSPNPIEEWFATGDEKYDSIMLFSFTDNENAEKGIDLIIKYNEQSGTEFPVRAFIVPVEKSNY